MRCYRCEAEELVLLPLWPYERELYPVANIVMRQCVNCGLEQSHVNDGEELTAQEAARMAPTATD